MEGEVGFKGTEGAEGVRCGSDISFKGMEGYGVGMEQFR